MASTKEYGVHRVVHWYYGNFCTRKCFNHEERMFECQRKLEEFIKKNKSLKMTHKEFKDMIDNDEIKICKLSLNFRKRSVSWQEFEKWKDASNLDYIKL